jgi:hypothetical protein
MEPTMTVDDFHQALARDMLGSQPSDDDALTLMILLHTHHVWLPRPLFSDRPGVVDLAAITRWHAAELVASAWPDRSNSLRADADYWHQEFSARAECRLHPEGRARARLHKVRRGRAEWFLERGERRRG